MTSTAPLTLRTKLGYGVGDLGTNLAVQSVSFFLLYYLTNVVGFTPASAGLVVLLGKLWDACIDPFVGALSDRTQSRFGKRRVYFLVAAVPFGLAFAALWFMPAWSDLAQHGYALLVLIVFSTCLTLFNIPYCALTPDLSSDYHQRTSLTSYRMMFAIVGTLVGAGATAPIVASFGRVRPETGYHAMAGIYGAGITACVLLAFLGTRGHDTQPPASGVHSFRDYTTAFRNGPFVTLLIMFFFSMLALTVLSANLVYFINDVLRLRGTLAQVPMGLLLLAAMASLPAWVALARHLDKRNCHMIGLSIVAVTVTVMAFTAASSTTWFLVLVAVTGVGIGTTFVFNWALIPDCIEYEELRTGRRSEGLIYGVWFFGQKVAMAVGIAINGFVLGSTGYQAGLGDAVQAERAVRGIQLLQGPVPTVFLLLSLVALHFYPITPARFAEIVAQLEARRSTAGREIL